MLKGEAMLANSAKLREGRQTNPEGIPMIASNIDISSTQPDLTDLVNRASSRQEIITLTAQDQQSAVLLSLEAFEYLIGLQQHRYKQLMSPIEFEQQFRQALTDAGYDSREKIVNLVRSVKKEMYEERRSQS